MNAKEITLDKNGFASESGFITVYNYHAETREFISKSVEYLPVGVGVPGNSCVDVPMEQKEGFAICRNAASTGWEYIIDHRGETVYSTVTGDPVIVSKLGAYPEDTTTTAPSTPYDKFDGQKWVTDNAAQHTADVAEAERQKTSLLKSANAKISLWQTELQLGIITEDDKSALIAWIGYIKAVQAVDTSTAPNITWPKQPQ